MRQELTPQEKLQAAYLHLIEGVEQQLLATIFRVNNGRVNEAVMAVRAAIGMGGPGYKGKTLQTPEEESR